VKRPLKIGASVLIGIVVLVLFTLRLTGLEPADNGANSRPGLWLPGEVDTSPVTDWSFTDRIPRMMIETRAPYLLPHSVTTNSFSRDGQLYMTATYSRGMVFPKGKFWTANVARDPRVRVKIDGRVYEMTLVLIADRAEAEAVLESKWQKYPEMRPKSQMGHIHVYRLFQRNIPEYASTEHP
jgi:hypothetical protein